VDLDPAALEELHLVAVAGAGAVAGAAHADHRVDVAGLDAASLLQPSVEGAQNLRRALGGVTDDGQVVAAVDDLDAEPLFDLREVPVELSRRGRRPCRCRSHRWSSP
jgi:hypothetical protein